jgi:adenylate kinase family enzyme
MLVTLFGKPGAGKTTLGDFLAQHDGFQHLALSRLLQSPKFLAEVGIDSRDMHKAIAAGVTISTSGLFDWLDNTITTATRPIVVDGYPREPIALERFNLLAAKLSLNISMPFPSDSKCGAPPASWPPSRSNAS